MMTTKLRLPSRIFRCLSIEDMRTVKVEVIPPSIWLPLADKQVSVSDIDKEEAELLNKIFPWKVVFDGKLMWIPKEQLGVLLEKYEETEQR